MDKNITKLVEEVKKALGDNLKSFVVYGSAATGEVYKTSDYNTIIVMNTTDTIALKKISKPVESWVKNGQPIPLIFTIESMKASQDVFPIEFLDIKENHVVLFGEDVFSDMKITSVNLRLEIERELKSKLIRLRQSYIMTAGNEAKIKILLARSISTFVALLKGAIRLYGKKAPSKKADIIDASPDALKLDKELFKQVLSLKEEKTTVKNSEVESIFGKFMAEIERIADIIDKK